ncbi:MAG: segregation/condensation protein A [Oscillospiraceae bacterium]|nr:segregation/condensation protein A [Oscillospiraceae bacterium]
MMALEFHIGEFDGPLDLLLFLISKHKMNIADIEISVLLEQYLDYMADMREADLEISSEFLEMAARLVYIKTVSLLPRHEEAKELKKELEGQLLEYQLLKEVAVQMAPMYKGNRSFVRRPSPIKIDPTYTGSHRPDELLSAYMITVGKGARRLPPPPAAFKGIVAKRVVSVTSRIFFVLRKLYRTGEMPYNEFFAASDRSELVATFLAMLELIKSKRITVSDDNSTVYFSREKRRKAAPESE